MPRHQHRQAVAVTDILEQGLAVGQVQPIQQHGEPLLGDVFVTVAKPVQFLFQQPLPQGDAFLRLEVAEMVADRGASLGGRDKTQPLRIGPGPGRGNDFNRLPVLKHRLQRGQLAVDARRYAGIADIGMHGIGEIHYRGIARQLDDLAARGKDVNLALK